MCYSGNFVVKLQNITPEEIKIIILIAAVFIAGLVVIHQRGGGEPVALVERADGAADSLRSESFIVVDVGGAVWKPGVYTLPEGSRAAAVLDLAMPRPDADIDRVNRARVLHDGQKLVVPVRPDAGGSFSYEGEARVDINSATAEQIQTLPSIGPARAADIVSYRERRGPFSSVEELADIPGIGEATVERLRDRIVIR